MSKHCLLLNSLVCVLLPVQAVNAMQQHYNAINNAQTIHAISIQTRKAWNYIIQNNLHQTTTAAEELLLTLDAKQPLIQQEFKTLHQNTSPVDKLYALANHLSCNMLGQWGTSNNSAPINIAISEYQAIIDIREQIAELKKNN